MIRRKAEPGATLEGVWVRHQFVSIAPTTSRCTRTYWMHAIKWDERPRALEELFLVWSAWCVVDLAYGAIGQIAQRSIAFVGVLCPPCVSPCLCRSSCCDVRLCCWFFCTPRYLYINFSGRERPVRTIFAPLVMMFTYDFVIGMYIYVHRSRRRASAGTTSTQTVAWAEPSRNTTASRSAPEEFSKSEHTR